MEDRRIDSRSAFISLVAVACCLFLWPALITLHPGDWPSPHQYPHNDPALNACGLVGAFLAFHLYHLIGDGTFPLLLFLTMAALTRLVRGEVGGLMERVIGLTLLIICTAASSHLMAPEAGGVWPEGSGGVIGYAMGNLLRDNLDRLGTLIILGSSFVVGLLFVTEGWILRLPSAILYAGRASGQAIAVARDKVSTIPFPRFRPALSGVSTSERDSLLASEDEEKSATAGKRKSSKKTKGSKKDPTLFDEEDVDENAPLNEDEWEYYEEEEEEEEVKPIRKKKQTGKAASQKKARPHDPSVVDRVKKALGVGHAGAKGNAGPIVNMPSAEKVADKPYPTQIENWRLPSLELLDEPAYDVSAQRETTVRRQAQVLEQTLEEFRLDARVVEIDTGPVITMFELKLGAGIKVSQIATLSNDIARALKAHAIRVVAPISGKNTVGIEVPNLVKEAVRLRELIAVTGSKASEMELPLFLGKDAGGAALVTDLTRMPHLLIAGTTGSGKSVCINTIILSLLMTKRPDHVKMILIDPKMVEMSQFKEIPHLMSPIVTDMLQAQKILEWAVGQMDERYEQLAEAGVKNINAFNALGAEELYKRLAPVSEEEKKRISVHLPYMVILIDELADLMMTSAKEVEHHLSRLAQKSRAVGIHIIVATQRPEAKVVTGLIKSNLPSRICFRVASRMDSRIVLDQNGGEVLLGQGDLLFLPPGSHKLTRAQGTFLTETEIQAVLNDLHSRSKPEFHPELVRIRSKGITSDTVRDPLFDQAVRIILQSKRGSVSLIQRRLNVGYSRASRLIDQMAAAGIVGDYKGSQAREVMMTLDQWESLHQQVAEELESGYEADEEGYGEVATDEAEDVSNESDEEGSEESDSEDYAEDECDGEEEEAEDEEQPLT